MLTGSNIWQLTQCNSVLAENPRNDCFISFGRGLFPQPALASPWSGDNSRSGSLPRRRIQSGLRLLDTDCRIKDGWGREVTADCGGTLLQIALFVRSIRSSLRTNMCQYSSCQCFRDFTHSNVTEPQQSL